MKWRGRGKDWAYACSGRLSKTSGSARCLGVLASELALALGDVGNGGRVEGLAGVLLGLRGRAAFDGASLAAELLFALGDLGDVVGVELV